MLRGVEVAEPHPGNKVGIGRLEGGEVTVEGQQNERVLLDVVPASPDPVGQQSSHDLGNEIRLGSHRDQSIEHDGVGAAVGMQQQIGVLAVVRDECGCAGGLDDSVVEDPLDTGFDGVVVDYRPNPGEGIRLQIRASAFPKGEGGAGVSISAQQSDMKRVGQQHVPASLAVVGPGSGLRCICRYQRPLAMTPLGHGEALVLGDCQRMHRLNRLVWARRTVARPPPEAAVAVLEGRQFGDVAAHGGVEFVGAGETLGLEGPEHVAQCGDGQDAAGVGIGAGVPIIGEVQHGVGQGLERGR